MNLVIVGGFMCAMNNCNENSGASRHLSFFRFPSDLERAKVWLQACGINISPKKLYNNYRVCSKHFASHMFLNDLKNRLQAHAVPSTVFNIEESTSTENSTIQEDTFSAVATCSTTNLTDVVSTNLTENVNVSNDQTSKNDKATQTKLKLSNSSPRKVALRRKCDAAEKRAKRIKVKYEKEEKSIEDITFSDFQKLLYKFYPKPMADFMKA